MTYRRDILLIIAVCFLAASAWSVAVPLGLAVTGVVLTALWWLVGNA